MGEFNGSAYVCTSRMPSTMTLTLISEAFNVNTSKKDGIMKEENLFTKEIMVALIEK